MESTRVFGLDEAFDVVVESNALGKPTIHSHSNANYWTHETCGGKHIFCECLGVVIYAFSD